MEFRGSIQCYGHGPREKLALEHWCSRYTTTKIFNETTFHPKHYLSSDFRLFFVHCSYVQGFLGKNLFPYSDLVLTNAHILEPILTVPSRSGIPEERNHFLEQFSTTFSHSADTHRKLASLATDSFDKSI